MEPTTATAGGLLGVSVLDHPTFASATRTTVSTAKLAKAVVVNLSDSELFGVLEKPFPSL
jgi:hypothetical protein